MELKIVADSMTFSQLSVGDVFHFNDHRKDRHFVKIRLHSDLNMSLHGHNMPCAYLALKDLSEGKACVYADLEKCNEEEVTLIGTICFNE